MVNKSVIKTVNMHAYIYENSYLYMSNTLHRNDNVLIPLIHLLDESVYPPSFAPDICLLSPFNKLVTIQCHNRQNTEIKVYQ